MKPATDDVKRMRPKPRSRMPGSTRRASRNGRTQVDRDRLVEGGGVDLLDRPHPRHPGVRRQHVDRAELALDLVDEALGGLGVAQVCREQGRAAASLDDLCRDALGRVAVRDVVHGDGGSRLREAGAERGADASAPARDERDATLEPGVVHARECRSPGAV